MLKVSNLTVDIADKRILSDISFHLHENNFLAILGPNGAGKTTLIRAIMRVIKHEGSVQFLNKDIRSFSTVELARTAGVLMQKHGLQYDHTVLDVVSLGRYCYKSGIHNRLDFEDKKRIVDAIRKVNLCGYERRQLPDLSGGELQRVFLAQLFAQNPKILILDEPTNNLDIQYQIEVFEMISKWCKEKDHAIIAVIHDLNLAFNYASNGLLLKNGKSIAYGDIGAVLKNENLERAFDFDVAKWMKSSLSKWN